MIINLLKYLTTDLSQLHDFNITLSSIKSSRVKVYKLDTVLVGIKSVTLTFKQNDETKLEDPYEFELRKNSTILLTQLYKESPEVIRLEISLCCKN